MIGDVIGLMLMCFIIFLGTKEYYKVTRRKNKKETPDSILASMNMAQLQRLEKILEIKKKYLIDGQEKV